MKKILSVVVFLFFCFYLKATEQIKDSLVYNGQGYYIERQFDFLFENELRQFVEERNKLPEDFFYTALWRRYVAVFEIVNNRLLLKELNALVHDKNDSMVYFKNIVTKELQERIKSENFNGVIILADESDDYSFFNPDDIYNPNYKVLEFKNSMLKKELDFKYEELDGFRNDQFEKYKTTRFYRKDLRDCKKFKQHLIKIAKKEKDEFGIEQNERIDCVEQKRNSLFDNPHYTQIL